MKYFSCALWPVANTLEPEKVDFKKCFLLCSNTFLTIKLKLLTPKRHKTSLTLMSSNF